MSSSPGLRVKDVEIAFEDFRYRTPIKFGGVALDRATLLDVRCVVETNSGRVARGFGSMPLGNVWSFPSKVLSYDATLAAMKDLAERLRQLFAACTEVGHPLDLHHVLEPLCYQAADALTAELNLTEPIPRLCTLVVASPFDAAVHDAFGKAHGVSSYHTYGPDFLPRDLGHYLGADFTGDRLDRYVNRQPRPTLPLYHLVGALDPLTDADLTPTNRIDDGLPLTLPQWIRQDGLTHLKVKLNGENLDWDVQRLVSIDTVAAEVQAERGVEQWVYSLDFNEKCPSVDYLLEFLSQVRQRTPRGFDRVQYIEQPTARDLKANRHNVMHEAAKLRPVVIDESLIDLESLQMARQMGYTGVALKACKGQSGSLLMAAAAQKMGLFLCVQDLTCPGASLIHSVGLAARVPTVAAIESNARQYVPEANRPWADRFPGVFRVRDGLVRTDELTGPGLSAVV